MGTTTFFAACMALLLPAAAQARAHGCPQGGGYKSWDVAYESARSVIEAIVVKGKPKGHPASTTLDVQRSWKGAVGPGKVTILSKHDRCRPYPFTRGERYIVYLDYQGGWPKEVTLLRAVNQAWAASDEDRRNLPLKLRQDDEPRAIDGKSP